MKTAFLLVALTFITPCLASGSEPEKAAETRSMILEARPSVEGPTTAPAIRRKVRYPAEEAPAASPARASAPHGVLSPEQLRKKQIVAAYQDRTPKDWGETVEGVKTRLDTSEPVIALTFDACGGPRGNRVDTALVEYLIKEQIPATLFVSGSWIDANPAVFNKLASIPLFEIANHGLTHRPCSVNGKSAYGIRGTGSVGEVFDEIEKNGRKIEAVTNRKPHFYRPGTAYCDEVAVMVAGELGYEVVNYSVLGDAGATWPAGKIRQALLKAGHGDIVVLHMNQPHSQTATGLKEAVPLLREKGYRFVKLSEYPLQ